MVQRRYCPGPGYAWEVPPRERTYGPAPGRRTYQAAVHRKDGGQCVRSANRGATVCNSHGGAAVQVRDAARRRVAEAAAADACELLGVPVETTAADALQRELNRTQAHVTWLRGQLIELGEPAIGGPWWQLYGQERDRLVVVCKAMLAADVQGRLQAVAKETAEQFRYALEAITDALNLSPAQRAMLPKVVPRVLSLVTMPDGDDDGPPRGA